MRNSGLLDILFSFNNLSNIKKLIKYYPEIKKRDESKLNYFIAMDYKDKNKEKNYLYYLKKSIKADNPYSESFTIIS